MGSYPIWILILINLRHLVFGAALVGIFASIPRLTETTGRRTAAAVLLGVSVVIAVLLSPPAAQLQTLGGIPGLLLLVLGGAAAAAARLKPGIGLFCLCLLSCRICHASSDRPPLRARVR